MKNALIIILIILVTLETLCQITGVIDWENGINAIIYFISGILIALLPLIKIDTKAIALKNDKWINYFCYLLFFIALFGLIWYGIDWTTNLFNYYKLSYKKADMLPIIQIMCQRFGTGASVYETVPFWEGTEPIYLPAMWLPFFPFSLLGIDIRWANFFLMLLGLFLIYFIGGKARFTVGSIFVFLPLYLLVDYFAHTDSRLLYMTEEPVVIAYYLLLGYALAKQQPYLIGFALSLCLMSRFSLAFWSMMYIGYVFYFKNRKDAIRIGVMASSISLLLLLGTGAIGQLDLILRLPKIYVTHLMENEWKFNSFTNNHLGLLQFFSFESLAKFHQLFFIANMVIPTLSLLFYWKFKDKINKPFFAICSLKLSLVFFYNLLIMPFLYLFYTSTFLSIAILSWYLKIGD